MVVLVESVFITNTRCTPGPNHYSRYEIFKWTLETYKKIKFEKMHFFIKLDEEFKAKEDDITAHIHSCFPYCPIEIAFTRYTTQEEWRPFMTRLYEENGPEALIWFLQNDDHPFLDFDSGLWEEGLELMRKDAVPYKSMYVSHWPEILRLTGKLGTQERVGNFVKFRGTLLDSFQIHNMAYIKHLFLELDWKGNSFNRIDGLVIMPNLTCSSWTHGVYRPTEPWQTIYVPLREFCRKFNGYEFQNIDSRLFPRLKLPPEENIHDYSENHLINRMTCFINTGWTEENKFQIPNEWVEHMLKLYIEGRSSLSS